MDLLRELQRISKLWRTKAARIRERDNAFATAIGAQALETCAEDVESLIWAVKQEGGNEA